MFLLGCVQRMIQSAPQLCQPLRECLPRATDLFFAPALSLADHRMDALFNSNELLIAFRNQFLGLALTAVTGCLYCISQALSRVGQILLDVLKLLGASP